MEQTYETLNESEPVSGSEAVSMDMPERNNIIQTVYMNGRQSPSPLQMLSEESKSSTDTADRKIKSTGRVTQRD